MQRFIALLATLLLALGLTAGSALAHHGPIIDGPPNNPHTSGIPQEFWEEGLEGGVILDEDGNFIPVPEAPFDFFVPVVLPAGTEDRDLDLAAGNFWLVFRIGGEGDPDDLRALRFEGWEPDFDAGFLSSLAGDFDGSDLVAADTEEPTKEFVAPPPEGKFVWVLFYPHPHSIILHFGTDRERCVDLANEQDIGHPNQHNGMHIGRAGQDTPGTGFANAGHMIVPMTCEAFGL